jgi:hypothetical protein
MSAGSTDWSFDTIAWLFEHDATVVEDPASSLG